LVVHLERAGFWAGGKGWLFLWVWRELVR